MILVTPRVLFLLACFAFSFCAKSQDFQSVKSEISFFGIDYDDIAADNLKGKSNFNSESGVLNFSIPIKEFIFEKSLMQEHFNEKYIESDEFPTAQYRGEIVGFELKEGKSSVNTIGKITIHGVTQTIKAPGMAELRGNELILTSKFKLKIEDFDIRLPKLFFVALTEEVEVSLRFTYRKKGVN